MCSNVFLFVFKEYILFQSFNIARGTQVLTFTSQAPAGAAVQGAAYLATATSSAGLTVALTSLTPTVCTISGSGLVSYIAAGGCTLAANQAGDANVSPAAQAIMTFTVFPGTQTISFTSTVPTTATVSGPTYTVAATSTSGLPVSYSIASSSTLICSLAGTVVSFIGGGVCTIEATQGGNANFRAAAVALQLVTVLPGSQTVQFTRFLFLFLNL